MPYFPYNLRTYIQQKGLLLENDTRSIIKAITFALKYFHQNNHVYNDLKPDNILIDNKEGLRAVLSDFGTVTQTGTKEFKGTPLYSSP